MAVMTTSGPEAFMTSLAPDPRLVHVERLPARRGRTAELARPLPRAIWYRLGVDELWSHQAEAIDHVRDGRSVVVATGTASGKSLCYQAPIAASIVEGLRPATSLLLFPTKALAQDQLRALDALRVPKLVAATYDGDATTEDRSWVRQHANVVLTNPEMLHHGILPNHARWDTFLMRLRYVVVDELHLLRGVFGGHVAHVLRRLRRVCAHYGSEPVFVFSSATIGAPEHLASTLCGLPVHPVTDDGSPRGERLFLLWNPTAAPDLNGAATLAPVTGGNGAGIDASTDARGDDPDDPDDADDADAGCATDDRFDAVAEAAAEVAPSPRRASAQRDAARLVAELVHRGHRTIAFCRSRKGTELVAAEVTRHLSPGDAALVRAYRAGYLADERREIEADLHSGRARAVVTTTALELGVDIGGLDACVLNGFPGTIASLWQQAGRVGRDGQPSVIVLVGGDDQLDQWYLHHPDEVFRGAAEPAVVNLSNPAVLLPHLACAAYELPLSRADERWWPELLDDGVRTLVTDDALQLRARGRGTSREPIAIWSGQGWPADKVGVRGSRQDEVGIALADGTPIGTVDGRRAAAVVHPGAVYLHRGRTFRVVELDLDRRVAVVARDRTATHTQPRSSTDLSILHTEATRRVGGASLSLGTVRVVTRVVGYRHIDSVTGELLGVHDLHLPASELVTRAFWYTIDPDLLARAGLTRSRWPGTLHAIKHAAIGIMPLFAICDRWDIGGVSTVAQADTGAPTIVIHDGHHGGAGIAELGYRAAGRHIDATLEVIESCACEHGCPSCVQSPACGNGNEPLDKEGAVALLQVLT